MKTRSSLYALLLLICGNVITAMEQEIAQNTKSNQQNPSPQLFIFTSDLARALQKRSKVSPKDNIIHRYENTDNQYALAAKAIKTFSQTAHSSKPYILLCADFQHPDQNIFSCSMFDVTNQQWIYGQKIIAHRDKDLEILVPELYLRKGGTESCPFGFAPDMNNSSFAIINMDNLNVPPYLCGKLAQGLKARGIPVIFNMRKEFCSLLLDSPDTLSLLLKEPESYETDKQKEVDTKIATSSTENPQLITKNQNNHPMFSKQLLYGFGGLTVAFITYLCSSFSR